MLFHLAGTTAASHTDILDSATKACHFMTFKMSQADDNIRIHDSSANFGLFHVFAVLDWYFHFVSTPQAIADNNLAACRNRVISV